MLVGEYGLEAGTQKQLSAHVSLGDMCADKREQLLFVLLIFQESAVPVTLRDWSTAIADSFLWAIPTSLLRESFDVSFLWVIIPYSVNALGTICYLGLQIWYYMERHILAECLSCCGSHHVDNSCHIQHHNGGLFACSCAASGCIEALKNV